MAENIALGDQRDRRARARPRGARGERRRCSPSTSAWPSTRARKIWQLSVGEQQRVEILKALHRDARVLILDEPTAVLTPQEARELFATLRVMAADGRAIVFISHKLHEVLEVSDRITVLRGGRVVATVESADATPHALAALMVGREVETGRRQPSRGPVGEVVLEAHDLHAEGDRGLPALRGVSLAVRGGEIVGHRRRGGQRAARAGRGARPACAQRPPAEWRSRATELRAGGSARCDRARRRTRARGPARHGRRAEPLDRVEHRAQGLPRPGRERGAVPAPQPHRAARRRPDRALRRAGAGARHARPRSLGRQPAEGRDRARVRGRAARARRRGADARARRRCDRGGARAAAGRCGATAWRC